MHVLQDLVLDFKADNVLGSVTRRHARHFHHHRKRRGRTSFESDGINVGHTARVQAITDDKAVNDRARVHQLHVPFSSLQAS